MSGRLIGIARRAERRLPLEELEAVTVTVERGLDGDHKGAKFPRRQVTLLAIEAWRAASAELADLAGPVLLPWTIRRANLLVEGLELPRAKGAIIAIGALELEVTDQTVPCRRMDEAHPGLLKALHPAWRGGVTCRVLRGAIVRLGDRAEVLSSPPERRVHLPG